MKNLSRGILLVLFSLVLAIAPALQADPGDRFAAIAYSPKTGRYGWGVNYPNKAEAIARARRECGRKDARTNWCKNAWIALAVSDQNPGGWGSAWGTTAEEAKEAARKECLARNADARIVACVSASGD